MERKRFAYTAKKLARCTGKSLSRFVVEKYASRQEILRNVLFRACLAVGCVVGLAGCAGGQSTAWETYCVKYGVSVDNPTSEQENYYLDVWLETDEGQAACE